MKRHALRAVAIACLLVVGAVAALLLIGPRVEHRLIRKPLAPAQVAPAIHCPGARATMNCVLQHQAPPVATAKALHTPVPGAALSLGSVTATTSAAATSIYGVDFGWNGLSASGLRAMGARFAASYLSPEPNSKNWTLAAVRADHAAGISTVAVWEATATRAQDGYAAGVSDAQWARSEAAALGNTTEGIDAAIDCDCSVASVAAYFRGWHAVLGARGGAYGGYYQLLGLHQLGLLGRWSWQTYAWSDGLWLPASIAPLEQYLNGSLYDNDRAIAANFGQWPAPRVRKPRPRVICLGAGARHTRTCLVIQGQVRRWERAAAASARVYAGRRCGRNDHELAKLRSRRDWFARHLRRYPRVRHAAREPALRSTGRAIARELAFLRREQCVVFGQRDRYFTRRVAAAQREWAR